MELGGVGMAGLIWSLGNSLHIASTHAHAQVLSKWGVVNTLVEKHLECIFCPVIEYAIILRVTIRDPHTPAVTRSVLS